MISFKNVYKKLGGETVLGGVTFTLPENSIYCLTGPSGCGKTTTLRIIAGLEVPDSGDVIIPGLHEISCAFQEPRLLPWKTAEENVEFVLRDVLSPGERWETAREYLSLVGLWPYRNYYPAAMSGGMRQRVGLCRAFAYPHTVLLLDEPFQSLDMPLKIALLKDVIKLWEARPRTVVCVIHDLPEAVLLAHRILVFSRKPAVIKKEYPVYSSPLNRRLADPVLAGLVSDILGILEEEVIEDGGIRQ